MILWCEKCIEKSNRQNCLIQKKYLGNSFLYDLHICLQKGEKLRKWKNAISPFGCGKFRNFVVDCGEMGQNISPPLPFHACCNQRNFPIPRPLSPVPKTHLPFSHPPLHFITQNSKIAFGEDASMYFPNFLSSVYDIRYTLPHSLHGWASEKIVGGVSNKRKTTYQHLLCL